MSCHSFQAIAPLSREEFDRLVAAARAHRTDRAPYWRWNKNKKHYHVEDYSHGLEATAYHGDHGYYMEFIIHLDRLLFGVDSHQLPTASELSEVKRAFAWRIYILYWLHEILCLPPYDVEDSQAISLHHLRQFYDRFKIQRIDPAINITGLSQEEITLYSRVLNCGNWNNDRRQHFATVKNPDHPHPKTFINSCSLETYRTSRNGEQVTSVRINCYDKRAAVLDKRKDPKAKHKPTKEQLANAKGIYRLEVQIWQPYIESLLIRKIIKSRAIDDVLTADFSAMILRYYIHQFAGDGDYYRLTTAKRKIQASKKKIASKSMRDKLCTFIQLLHDTYKSNEEMLPLNEALSLVEKQMGVTAETIDSYRQQLVKLNINPITLPNDSSIKCLKNPLYYVLESLPRGAADEETKVSENEKESVELYGESRNYGTTRNIEDWELPF